MFTLHVDLGQLIISLLIGIVAWFTKRMLDKFDVRLDRHETMMFNFNGDLQAIMGNMGIERRKTSRKLDGSL